MHTLSGADSLGRDVTIDGAPVAIWFEDRHGALVRANARARALFALEAEAGARIGLRWLDDGALARVREGLGVRGARAAHPADAARELVVDVDPLLDAEGRFAGFALAAIETSAPTAGADGAPAAADPASQLRAIASALPAVVWTTEPGGRAPAWLELVHPQDAERALEAWRASLASGAPFACEYRLREGSSGWRWHLGRAQRVGGTGPDWLGIHLDIEERKRLELELEEARDAAERASLAKDRFLAVLSHELRTPLTPVLMLAGSLEHRHDLPSAVREELGMLRRNVELEARLIDDLLDLTRIARGKLALVPHVLDVAVVLQEAARICSPEVDAKALRLQLDAEPGRLFLEADAARLQQTFWNLLQNAIKFTQPGGRITVRARADGADAIAIEVEDDGIGIEPSVLARIFDAFEQGDPDRARRFGGLGLGLAIAKAVVEMHAGTIEAHSEGVGHGAMFRVRLPVRRGASGPRRPGNGPASRDGVPTRAVTRGRLSILCVEDHPDTARLLGQLLRNRGHEVRVVTSAAAAQAAFAEQRFDLVLSDLGLPDGHGCDLMRGFLEQRPALIGIALTGYGADEDVRACREAGFSEHLTKPIDFRELEGAILRHSAGARA